MDILSPFIYVLSFWLTLSQGVPSPLCVVYLACVHLALFLALSHSPGNFLVYLRSDRSANCCVNTVDEKISTATNSVNFGPVTREILWLICMGGGCTYSKIRSSMVFKGYSLGGNSIEPVCMQVRDAQSHNAHAGRATRWALPRFLVNGVIAIIVIIIIIMFIIMDTER